MPTSPYVRFTNGSTSLSDDETQLTMGVGNVNIWLDGREAQVSAANNLRNQAVGAKVDTSSFSLQESDLPQQLSLMFVKRNITDKLDLTHASDSAVRVVHAIIYGSKLVKWTVAPVVRTYSLSFDSESNRDKLVRVAAVFNIPVEILP